MKSTNAVLAALASTVIAQPHAHQHAHLHGARLEHQHHHDKRVLATETVVEWVTETVVEMIDATTTEWVTEGASTATPTTLSTVIASPTSSQNGEFFETASTSSVEAAKTKTPVAVAQPVETTSTTPTTTPEPTTTTSAYVAPVEPTTATTSTEEPVVVATTPTTTSEAAAATTAASATVSSGSGSGSISGTTFSGKLTWIGDTTGAYSACGQPYEADSMFVAVDPSVLDCGSDGMGSAMTITANGKTVTAVAIDKCMGCDETHIDVASAVWTALGYTFDDGGMHDNAGLSWVLSATK